MDEIMSGLEFGSYRRLEKSYGKGLVFSAFQVLVDELLKKRDSLKLKTVLYNYTSFIFTTPINERKVYIALMDVGFYSSDLMQFMLSLEGSPDTDKSNPITTLVNLTEINPDLYDDRVATSKKSLIENIKTLSSNVDNSSYIAYWTKCVKDDFKLGVMKNLLFSEYLELTKNIPFLDNFIDKSSYLMFKLTTWEPAVVGFYLGFDVVNDPVNNLLIQRKIDRLRSIGVESFIKELISDNAKFVNDSVNSKDTDLNDLVEYNKCILVRCYEKDKVYLFTLKEIGKMTNGESSCFNFYTRSPLEFPIELVSAKIRHLQNTTQFDVSIFYRTYRDFFYSSEKLDKEIKPKFTNSYSNKEILDGFAGLLERILGRF